MIPRALVRILPGASLAALALAACGPGESPTGGGSSIAAPSSSATGGPISAVLTEMDIRLSAESAPAGRVTFEVRNGGELPHEFLVIRTDQDAADLPFEDFKVLEEQLDIVAEVRDLAAGESATLSAELEAGHYVVICNLSGHYEAGMYGPGMRSNFDVR